MNLVLKPLSPEEYLDGERQQQTRPEYLNGYVYAVSGVSCRHSCIPMNMAGTLWPRVTERGCRIHQAEVTLALGKLFYYPDGRVAGVPEPENPYYETDPCVLVEALWPSTAQNDLREKVLEYKRITSLQTYLIVDPNSYFARHFWRDGEGNWQQEDITGSSKVRLECLQTSLSLSQCCLNDKSPIRTGARICLELGLELDVGFLEFAI